jgi:NAD-dependent dihydropyrimidine dehydrogenase PreA subunit
MGKDFSTSPWHGIPRKDIPWFPTIDASKCIGCELCYVTCGREVFAVAADERHRATVIQQYNCMVGCSTCGMVCPTQAITFPDRDLIWRVEREHKIFSEVRKEAAARRDKAQAVTTRESAQKSSTAVVTRAKIEIAGEFGDKQFLVKLEELAQGRPYDIVNLRLDVPSVKALREKTPAYMTFEVTSTAQEDVGTFLDEIRGVVRDSQLILVSATPA